MIETNGSFRVLRGGGWISDVDSCEASYRLYSYSDNGLNFLGIRVFRRLQKIKEEM